MKLDNTIRKIAVFRALQLGDLLCSIPAIRALRAAFPEAKIDLLGLPWAASLVERFPYYFDSFIHFPGYPALPEQPFDATAFLNFLQRVQAEHYDLVLQMQGNGSFVNPMVELFGAKRTAGFVKKNDYCADHDFYLEYPEGISEIERHIRLMDYLGIPSQGNELEFPITEYDIHSLNQLALPLNGHRYVCIHPGSRGTWRQWPPAHFAQLADHCAKKGFQVVITGSKEEQKIVEEVTSAMSTKAIDSSGKTNLGAVAQLIKNASLLISNCTGVSHIASATKTKSIVISMDGEPERWAPLNKSIHRTINWLAEPDMSWVYRQADDLLSSC